MRAWAAKTRSAVLDVVAEPDLDDELELAYTGATYWREREVFRSSRTMSVMVTVSALVVVLLCVVIVVWLDRQDVPGLSIVPFAVGFIVGGLAFVALDLLPGRFRSFWRSLVTACLLGSVYLVLREADPPGGLADRPWLTTLASALVVLLLWVFAWTLFVRATAWLLYRHAVRTAPSEAVLSELFALVNALANPLVLKHKAWLLRLVNNAATTVELGLWRDIELLGPSGRATLRSRRRQCAQYLRSFDLRIALPHRDTRQELLSDVVDLIHVLVRGSLDELPTTSAGRRTLAPVANAAGVLLVRLLPLATVLIAVLVAPGLSLSPILIALAVAWFVLAPLDDSPAANRAVLVRDPKVAASPSHDSSP
ncbi:hypothetical protein LFM09_33010 [Lentzea alba]|uniref:hypothetical protein n=1 Tax=Lentzea alba TaxID=2714351 RepID=UPI0039BF336A